MQVKKTLSTLVLLTAGLASAQTALVLVSAVCPAGQQTIATQTGKIGTTFALFSFSCQTLDPGVTIDKTTTPPTVRAIPSSTGSVLSSGPEIPKPPTDGTTTVFTLANTPIPGSLLLFWNGLLQSQGVDYTLTGSTITMLQAPEADGAIFRAYYQFQIAH